MKKILLPVILISSYISAQAPAGYYDGTAGLTGYALKSKLHDIISEKMINWHYDDLKVLYGQTDLDKYYDHDASNTQYLLDIYSEIPSGPDSYEYTVDQIIAGASVEGMGYNREHMMPQSTFSTSSSISDYPMYSDLNFIIPVDAYINQRRSNYPYGVGNTTNHYIFSNTSRISNAAIPNYPYTGRVYEPINEFKGDIARSLLYFAVRYEGKLGSFNTAYTTSANLTPATDQCPLDGTEERAIDLPYVAMLKQWSAMDPVSQREIDRNNTIYTLQKNRNPFIDHPEWIDMIWSETPDNIPPAAPGSLASTQQNAHFINLSWTASPDTDVLGYRVYMNGSTTPVAVTKGTSVSIDHLSPSTTYTFTVKAFDKGYLESPFSNTVTASTIASDTYAPDLMITKYISGTNTEFIKNNALEIVNKTGHEVNLNNYRINIQFKNTNTGAIYNGDTYELEGKVGNNETFVILNPKGTLSCYTPDQAKFVTASDPMMFAGENYVELAYNKTVTVDAIGVKYTINNNGNVSLYRKNTINQPTSTFTISEWDSYPSNYCQDLGTLSTSELFADHNEFTIYPNPVDDHLYVTGETDKIKTAWIIDLSGKVIYTEKDPFRYKKDIAVQGIPTGIYFLKLDEKAHQFIKK
ncbi:endonuclease [Chryseobacterium gleum]|uniref:endonuclease n=1 Tax=Chryseobacterium gleum TaxID=250 RepID=UPI001E3FEEE4|nr:endonuclease [Chryseobacterium gleum]MCD9615805.1 endonuclease [Chryseobacterium gleum]